MISRAEPADAGARRAMELATLLHDLRDPLGVVLNASEMILAGVLGDGGEIPESALRHVAHIHRAGRAMQELMDEYALLLRRELDAAPVRAVVPVTWLLEDVRRACDASHGAGRVSVRAQSTACLVGDRALLRRMLVNLAANGLRHAGRDARVVVSAADGEGHVRITVRDGPGAAPVAVAHSREVAAAGAAAEIADALHGLGLAVVRRVLDQHGGTMNVERMPDGGHAVHLSLPTRSHP